MSQATTTPVTDLFRSLSEKADRRFSRVRDLPNYGRNRNDADLHKAFKHYTLLWKMQQEHRQQLTEVGLKRWEIGEIASRIAQLYYGHYLHTADTGSLAEAYIFYEAVLTRDYFSEATDPGYQSLAVKKLRFLARFLTVCLVLGRRDMLPLLVMQLRMLVDSCKLKFKETEFTEWKHAIQEGMECCCSTAPLNLRGFSSSYTYRSYSYTHHHKALSLNSKSFVQLTHKVDQYLYKGYLPSASSRPFVGLVFAESGRQAWDFGRFFRTIYFFNGPPNPAKLIEPLIKLISSTTEEPVKKMETSDAVLVAGATGGVGRRVVDILRKKGFNVRALVRNEEKARNMLGSDVDLIVGDITKEDTLAPEYFKGVKQVINAVSVIVGPKEGDTPDRAKYSQGIKFFEPEIKGDSPEMVEYIGMRNLINVLKTSIGLRDGKLLFGFKGNLTGKLVWGALDDIVMGGVSESTFLIDPTGDENGGPTGIFKGVVSTANNGGFTSIRTKNFSVPEDLSAYDGIELRVKGDGLRYKIIIRTSTDWDTVGYTASFDTLKGQWQNIRLPFSSVRPIFRARTVFDAPPFDPSKIISLQLMFSKFEYDGKLNPTFVEGAFQLPFSSIRAYLEEPITPRFVHVSSAGVTRPDRPGIDLSKQPPAVRLNKELGFILTFKLKGEDLIRESGIPYTIIRPCALTEEPAGADLIFDQGDNITGKISREEVARICVAALGSPYACDKTFEVKSTVPFSEPYTVDPSNPPLEKDYDFYFKTLKTGITGKEALEESPVPA